MKHIVQLLPREFPSHSLKKEIQRMDFLFRLAIGKNKLMDGVPVKITIKPSNNNVYLNGTPIGDYRKISNISSKGIYVRFDYGNGGIYRVVTIVNKYSVAIFSYDQGFVLNVDERKKHCGRIKCIVNNNWKGVQLCRK